MSSIFLSSIMLIVGVALCPILLIILSFWFFGLAIIKMRSHIIEYRQWKSTPCPNCIYFNDCHELKCAVNPYQVLTTKAVNCRDFELIIGKEVNDIKIRSKSI